LGFQKVDRLPFLAHSMPLGSSRLKPPLTYWQIRHFLARIGAAEILSYWQLFNAPKRAVKTLPPDKRARTASSERRCTERITRCLDDDEIK
jgi:hypothetical protein